MGRQLFLHHYLPAHLASSLVAGALMEFIFTTGAADEAKSGRGKAGKHLTARERLAGQSLFGVWVACGVICTILAGGWYFFLPLTYGYPGLSVEEVQRRKWLGYDLHFAK